jgi:ABC-2 type transport system permease protein
MNTVPFRLLLRHEWRLLTADRVLWILSAVFIGLAAAAVVSGITWTDSIRSIQATATTDTEHRLDRLRSALETIPADAPPPAPFGFDPRSPGLVGASAGAPYVSLPPSSLAPLAVGQTDLLPTYIQVTTQGRQSYLQAAEIENPDNLLEGRLDLAFVIVYLFPLLILGVSYNLLSTEREQGTLAMVLAEPISPARVVRAKVAVRAAATVGLAVTLTIAALVVAGLPLGAPEILSRFMLWTLVVAGYGLFWLALAVWVNSGRRSSATNAMWLAAVWLVLVVLVPAVLNLTVQSLHPLPSRVELIGAMRTAAADAQASGAHLLERYYGDHPELAPDSNRASLGEFMARTYAVQDAVDRQVAPLTLQFDQQVARQQALVERYRFLSPAVTVAVALGDVTGTGPERYRYWREQVDRFHAVWQEFFLPRIFTRRLLTREDYAVLPAFEYQEEPDARMERRVLASSLGVILPALIILALAGIRLRRVRVAA